MFWVKALINFMHLSSVTAWIGSIIFISIILFPVFKSLKTDYSTKVLVDIFRVLKIISYTCIIIFIISGILLSMQQSSSEISFTSAHGILFIVKHLLILVIICLIFIAKLIYFPKIKNVCQLRDDGILCIHQKQLSTLFIVSAVLGFIIILITAFMQQIS
jgi:putative copper export protein